MKHVYAFFLLAFSLPLMSQTSVIAHKSHSGQMKNFSTTDYDDNLGLPSPRLIEVIKIDDSTAVMVRIQPMMEKRRMYDTIRSNPIEHYVKSYLKHSNIDRINLVGFDSLRTKIILERKEERKGSFYAPSTPKITTRSLLYGLVILASIFSFFMWQKQKNQFQ